MTEERLESIRNVIEKEPLRRAAMVEQLRVAHEKLLRMEKTEANDALLAAIKQVCA